jgi:hypothetical protein
VFEGHVMHSMREAILKEKVNRKCASPAQKLGLWFLRCNGRRGNSPPIGFSIHRNDLNERRSGMKRNEGAIHYSLGSNSP